jgi:hypothetical protein
MANCTHSKLTQCACRQSKMNLVRVRARRAHKAPFYYSPCSMGCSVSSWLGPAPRPCDWTDPADVVFHSVTQKPVCVCVCVCVCPRRARRLLFYACTKNQLVADAARVVPLSLSLFRLIYHLRRPRYLHAKSVQTRESAPCFTPLPADLWRKLRFNFAADKINRKIGC